MVYENRIGLPLGFNAVSMDSLRGFVADKSENFPREPIDGMLIPESLSYDNECNELVFFSRGGPACYVARAVGSYLVGSNIKLAWTSDEFNRGVFEAR